jgi:hypothetical protein
MASQSIVLAKTVRANLDKAEQYGDKRDQMLIAAGKNLIQLKEETTHGQFTKLVRTHVTISVRRVQQLIGYANSPDPAEAIRKDRQETARRVAKIRANRKSAVRTSHSKAASLNGKSSQQVTAEEPRIKGRLKAPKPLIGLGWPVAFDTMTISGEPVCSTYSGFTEWCGLLNYQWQTATMKERIHNVIHQIIPDDPGHVEMVTMAVWNAAIRHLRDVEGVSIERGIPISNFRSSPN